MEYEREYTLRASNGTEILVDRPVDTTRFYEDWRVTIDGFNAEVKSVIRYRDGGTTDIAIDGGRLYVPSVFRGGAAYLEFEGTHLPLERV